MKVTLNIENDQELRAYIKDCIKGQVLAIVREDFQSMVMEELSRKIKGVNEQNFMNLLKGAFQSAVTQILYAEHKVADWRTEFVEPIVSKNVNAAIRGKNWDKMVDDLAKEKVRSLVK